MRDYKYPARFPGEVKALLEVAAKETGLSVNQLIVRCVQEYLPALRAEASRKSGRVTNVDPLPDKVMKEIYAQRQDDDESIRRFIAAQPKGAE
jgi:hypothetical protein